MPCQWLLLPLLIVAVQPLQAGVSGLVAVGLGGNDEYRLMFEEAANRTHELLLRNAANRTLEQSEAEPSSHTDTETDTETTGSNAGSVDLLLEHQSEREHLLSLMTRHIDFLLEQNLQQPESAGTQHIFVLALFGHGSFDGDDYKFNVSGPDLTASDLRQQLDRLRGIPQIILLATSASGAAIELLSASTDRLILTATKSGAESNVIQFPRFWSEALAGTLADSDHDDLLSVQEAFEFTNREVQRQFENQNQLATEHARLSGEGADMMVLARLGALEGTENNKEVNRLLEQRSTLETAFLAIRAKRDQMLSSEYLDSLEGVLLQIARLQLAIDRATGWKDADD